MLSSDDETSEIKNPNDDNGNKENEDKRAQPKKSAKRKRTTGTKNTVSLTDFKESGTDPPANRRQAK